MAKLTNTFSEIDSALQTSVNKKAVIYCGIDSLTAGEDDGAVGFNYIKWLQKYMNGVAGFGGVYVPFASFVQFTPQYFDNYFATLGNVGSGRNWVDSLPFSDSRKTQSVNGLGIYFDGTQGPTGNGIEVVVKIPYRRARLFYRQQIGGGTFDVDRPTYGESITGIDTNGAESIQYVDIEMYRLDTVNGAGTQTNDGYNIRINNISGIVQIHGILLLTDDNAPAVVNIARQGRKISDYASTSRQVRKDFLIQCGVTHSYINAGTNDAGLSTPAQFAADLNEIVSAHSEVVGNVTVVIPNYTAAESTAPYEQTYRDVAANNSSAVFDIPSVYGDYNDFVTKGWMLDNTHPNDFFYQWLGQEYCKQLLGVSKVQGITLL